MKIHVYEKAFLIVGIFVLAACALALVYATVVHGLHLPGEAGRIDPAEVATTPPFDRPGVYQRGEGQYEVVVVGRAWSFHPADIRVPAGAEITFTATSADASHGSHIEGTRLSLVLIAGQISRDTYRFSAAGEHVLLCHEYCGPGRHAMCGGMLVQEPGSDIPLVQTA